ncbi:MAG: hypothetical protein JNM80_14260 [Phycisphaerae bacterium]|nr:hypothetical protein [Phycisphaerae bacterium]
MVAFAAIVGLGERARAQAGCIVGWGQGVGGNGNLTPPTGSDWVEVAAGYQFCIGRLSDGSVKGWGRNDVGQATPPTGTFVSVSAGYNHAMALKANGDVVVWGAGTGNHGSSLEAPPGLKATAIAAGENWCMAIQTDGTIFGWGVPALVGANIPEGEFVEIAAGAHFGIARRADGTIAVWAAPHFECSRTVPVVRTSPDVVPSPLPPIVAIAAGHCTAYALTDYGYVIGWGGSFLCSQQSNPFDDSMYSEIAGGYGSAMARRVNGSIVAWGAQDEVPPCDPPDFCCEWVRGQTPIPPALLQITALRIAKGHSNLAHFVIVPDCP